VYLFQIFVDDLFNDGPGKLLLALAGAVIPDSESRWTHDLILLPHDSGSHATLACLPTLSVIQTI
jgi:hypothetical protein